MKTIVKQLARQLGFDVVRHGSASDVKYPRDFSDQEKEVCELVAPYTMTSVERIVALINATKYVIENDIPGDIVECGVWRGGSMMVIAQTLKQLGSTDRKLYLYDTFEGMSPPTEKDKLVKSGRSAKAMLEQADKEADIWCYADQKDVANNLRLTGYPESNIVMVKGKVEDTIPATVPKEIGLLRLDTDWYESTRHELEQLYPLLATNGVLIIDDYGHWRGSKDATDEYFSLANNSPLLHRIDYTGRMIVKTQPRQKSETQPLH